MSSWLKGRFRKPELFPGEAGDVSTWWTACLLCLVACMLPQACFPPHLFSLSRATRLPTMHPHLCSTTLSSYLPFAISMLSW